MSSSACDLAAPAGGVCTAVDDDEFQHPRLAAIYDALDPDRSDLDTYVTVVEELGAERVLDVGCGTGTLALVLVERGLDVVGVDLARASLAVPRAKAGADRVRWIHGDASALTVTDRDVAVMTGNVAQLIADPHHWDAALQGVHRAVRTGGHLVLETRDPAARAWDRWTREATYRRTDIQGVGAVTSWVELTSIDWPLVSFRWTWHFGFDGVTLTSDSTLRFRERDEMEADLVRQGFAVVDVHDPPDRPGLELVFLARRVG